MKESGQKEEGIKSDTLIGNFFNLKHCEGKETDEIQFVHRSIYEYFVTVYFFESIHNLKSKEEAAGKLGGLLKDGKLSKQILEFIKYKFNSMKEYDLSVVTREIFNIMLRDGMTYHFIEEQKSPLLNIIDREMNVFSNMLEVVGFWNAILGRTDNKIITYLRCNRRNKLNLSGADLSGADLMRADLSGSDLREADLIGADLVRADLSGAYLSGADLIGAYLSGACLREADLMRADLSGAYLIGTDLRKADLMRADLSRADLREADLMRTDLREADLSGADLSGADLSGADLGRADLREADLSGAYLIETKFDEKQIKLLCEKYDITASKVYISEAREIISYKEYCHKKGV